jgi:hypothetical protein
MHNYYVETNHDDGDEMEFFRFYLAVLLSVVSRLCLD